jgi:hypothetical protein
MLTSIYVNDAVGNRVNFPGGGKFGNRGDGTDYRDSSNVGAKKPTRDMVAEQKSRWIISLMSLPPLKSLRTPSRNPRVHSG